MTIILQYAVATQHIQIPALRSCVTIFLEAQCRPASSGTCVACLGRLLTAATAVYLYNTSQEDTEPQGLPL